MQRLYHGLFALLLASPLGAAEWRYHADIGELQYHAQETSASGALLNREDGSLPIQGLGIRGTAADSYVQLNFWQASNVVPYQGISQIGMLITTQTNLRLQDWEVRAGHGGTCSENCQWNISVGLDSLAIDRAIYASPLSLPLREQMQSYRALLGGEIVWDLRQALAVPLSLTVGLDVLRGLSQDLDVDSYGMYDAIRLHPAAATDLRQRITLVWAPDAPVRLWLTLQTESFQPGATDYAVWNRSGVASSLVRYPGSQQSLQYVVLGGNWQF